jgi:hypothetical protein
MIFLDLFDIRFKWIGTNWKNRVVRLVIQNRDIDAISLYRTCTGASFKDALSYIRDIKHILK